MSIPASTVTLGTKHLVQEHLAIAAKVTPTASVFPEQGLAELISGSLLSWFTLQLFGNRLPYEVGKRKALRVKTRSQVRFEFHWQTDGDRHNASGRIVIQIAA
jgi:hypothetical protein